MDKIKETLKSLTTLEQVELVKLLINEIEESYKLTLDACKDLEDRINEY